MTQEWRLATSRGPVHVWFPSGARPSGVVVYVHGHSNTVDEVWKNHDLPGQFAASGRDAVFIAPEAPTARGESVRWPDLDELLNTVKQQTGESTSGPIVAMGHSAGYATIANWLGHPRLKQVSLLDALYGKVEEYGAWAKDGGRLDLVAGDVRPLENSALLAKQLNALVFDRIPDSLQAYTKQAVLFLKSQYGHFEIVTSKKVIPMLLARTPIPALGAKTKTQKTLAIVGGGLAGLGITLGAWYLLSDRR